VLRCYSLSLAGVRSLFWGSLPGEGSLTAVLFFLSPCSSASQQRNHCVVLSSCDQTPCVRGEQSHPRGLSSSKASLQEVVGLHCKGSADLPPLSRPAQWLQTWLAFLPQGALPLSKVSVLRQMLAFVLRAWKICAGPLK